MKHYLIFSLLIISEIANSQQSQFSVVRPDGTTFIKNSWDSAYFISQDGDAIYFPGIKLQHISIDKELTIIGTGHNIDSAGIVGITDIQLIQCFKRVTIKNLAGGSIQSNIASAALQLYNVRAHSVNLEDISHHYIEKCIITEISGSCNQNYPNNSIIINSFVSYVRGLVGVSFKNCIVLGHGSEYLGNLSGIRDCKFENTIFYFFSSVTGSQFCQIENNIFSNCLFTGNMPENNPLNNGNFANIATSSIFIKGGTSDDWVYYSYKDNYRLQPNSPYLTAGTDGKQIGIYGGSRPWQDGSLPSNPYIYFKKVDENSSTDGKLKVEYKVRTSN